MCCVSTVCQMCCNLELKTLNIQKTTASLRKSPETLCVFQSIHLHYTAILMFFLSKVLHEVWRIFPRSFDTVVTDDVPTKYLIFLTKQTRKHSHFIDNIQHATWPFLNDFILPATWCIFVQKHWKVCCSILQWSDVCTTIWCRTYAVRFFRSLLRIFSSFPPIWVCEMKVLWKVHLPTSKTWKPFFYT